MTVRNIMLSTVAAISFGVALPAFSQNPTVRGTPMMTDKNIVANAMNSKDHTTLSRL